MTDKFMVSMLTFWNTITGEKEKGATATEYALLVGLIALVIIIGVTAFGSNLNKFFSNIASTVGTW
jgi:pilus assembly protein Flp/PilA